MTFRLLSSKETNKQGTFISMEPQVSGMSNFLSLDIECVSARKYKFTLINEYNY